MGLKLIEGAGATSTDSDAVVAARMPCFGISFASEDDGCMGSCEFRDRCVTRLAAVLVPDLEKERGEELRTISSLAVGLEVSEQTAAIVLAVLGGKLAADALRRLEPKTVDPVVDAVSAAAPKPPEPPPPPPPPPMVAMPPKSLPPPKAKALKVVPPPDIPQESEGLAGSGKVVEGAPPKKEDAPVKKSPKPKSSKPAAAVSKPADKPAPAKKTKPAATDAAYSAWARERARSPFVQALADAQVLAREFHGKPCVLRVDHAAHEYRLKHDGKETAFPTVYAATMAVTGAHEYGAHVGEGTRVMSNWSAPKFWGGKAKAPKVAKAKVEKPAKKAAPKAPKKKKAAPKK